MKQLAAAFSLALFLASPILRGDELVAPKITKTAEPVHPANHATESAVVVLELTIDVTGMVADATVTTSAGSDFDEAARAAAKELLFEPATRDGKPIAARIPFRFEFVASPPKMVEQPPASTPPAPPPPPVVDVVVEGARPPRETTKHVLEGEALRKTPGTNGDALRGLENLPGVARPPGISGALIVRGSAPQDTMVFVDGTWIPVVYHFGGVSSVIPSDLLQKIDFYPGNYSAEFGRAMGGIVDIGIRSPRRDRAGGVVQIDMLDGRVIAETPLSSRSRVLIAARRSWVDAWIGPFLRSAGNDIRTLPRYYDGQAVLEHDLSERTTARLLLFGSDDRLAVVVDGPDARDPAVSGQFAQRYSFYRAQLRTDTRVSDATRFINMVSYGHDTQVLTLGSNRIDMLLGIGNARSDLRTKIAPGLTVIAGIDALFVNYDVTMKFPPVPSEDTPGPFFGRPSREVHGDGASLRPALYAMLDWNAAKGLKLLPGVRVDWTPDIARVDIDPRFAARYTLGATTLKSALGVYRQAPLQEAVRPWGDGSLRSNTSYQASVGVEQSLDERVRLSIEAFSKHLTDLIVPRAAAATESGVAYDNTGSGRVIGLETLLQWKPGGRFFGWIAYTLSRSTRRDASGTHLFQYDQTHVLAAVASYDLGRGFTIGGRFRYVTGAPYTPATGGVVDLDAGAYEPVLARTPYSARVAPFHRLDVRIEKRWKLGDGSVAAYLDVQNVYNRQNPEGLMYAYDYSRSKPIAGLPILPILGLRGEL